MMWQVRCSASQRAVVVARGASYAQKAHGLIDDIWLDTPSAASGMHYLAAFSFVALML